MFRTALLSLLVAACVPATLETEDTGNAVAAIAIVPLDVSCIRITVNSPGRSIQRSFSVMSGQNAILDMKSLPTGPDTFLGEAFAGSCALVNQLSVPTWSSDTVAATLSPGSTSNIALQLVHNANATVSVDFVPDPSPQPISDGGVSPSISDGGVSPSPGPISDGGVSPSPGPIVDGGAHD